MNILRNRYVRAGISAVVAQVAARKIPKLFDWALGPELTPVDGVISDIEYYSVMGIVAGMTAVVLAAAFGAPEGGDTPPAGAA